MERMSDLNAGETSQETRDQALTEVRGGERRWLFSSDVRFICT
jgi:superfamily II DNA or RNA helicase